MSEHDDALYLIHMLESAQKAQAFIKDKSRADYNADEVLRLALAHLVQVIGEAARKVSEARQGTITEIPWKAIMGIRHRIVHNYMNINEEIIWRTIIEDLPPLIAALEAAITRDEKTDDAAESPH